MPDASKAKERRRAAAAREVDRQKNASQALASHVQESIQLFIPEGFHYIGGREDTFMRTDIAVYYSSLDKDYLLKLNQRLLGPFKKHELRCLMDCLKNDMEL